MRKNAYKDILDFLIEVSQIEAQGHHLCRLQTMAGLVHSCIKSKKCTLEGLSQPRPTCQATLKDSLLQQTKRWLGNKWVDWESFFLPFTRHFLTMAARSGELLLIVDGSQTGSANASLMISVLWRGFAIPLAWMVKKGTKGHFSEQMHIDLLQMLLPSIPHNCRVVLLGDGEFDGQKVLAWRAEHKWQFVLRTSCDRQVDFGGETARIDTLLMPKGHTSVFLPNALPGINAVFWHEKRFEKPIFLLTNMDVGKSWPERKKSKTRALSVSHKPVGTMLFTSPYFSFPICQRILSGFLLEKCVPPENILFAERKKVDFILGIF